MAAIQSWSFVGRWTFKRGLFEHAAGSLILLGYLLAQGLKDGCGAPSLNPEGLLLYAYSFLTLNLLIRLQHLLLGRWPRLRAWTSGLGAVLLVLLMGYHHARMAPLDYTTLALNADNGLGPGTLIVVVDMLGAKHIIVAALVALTFGAAEWRWKLFSHEPPSRWPLVQASGCLLAYTLVLTAPLDTRDAVTFFLRSWPTEEVSAGEVAEGFPYVRTEPARELVEPLPHVFLIMMESLNGRYVEANGPGGKPIMPVFRSLIPKGAYFDWFYGNSIQTSKGHAATLLSLIPSARRKILADYYDNCYRALPAILRDQGYSTIFAQAYANAQYEHGDRFYLQNGFDQLFAIAETHGEPKPGEAWGWGMRDDVFYRDVFAELDKKAPTDRPLFITLAPISNHVPFDQVPAPLRQIYKEPQSRHEHYSNSIHLSDAGLAVFFEELQRRPHLSNSLVVVTGDHSFPTGEHGFTSNVSSYQEEFFRTTLLLLWPEHIRPERVSELPFAQVDIAPTILDLLGVGDIQHHFLGRSVFERESRPIYLVQPYSGRFYAVVDAPFKYVRHARTGAQSLFHLHDDPEERNNLSALPEHRERLEALAVLAHAIDRNDALLARNQIWPCGQR